MEEEVGAFTKFIEAMGFTGPLKYNKWVSDGEEGGVQRVRWQLKVETWCLCVCEVSLLSWGQSLQGTVRTTVKYISSNC